MDAKEFLKKQNITDVIINKSDLPEYWKSITDLIEEYQALQLQQNSVIKSVCSIGEYEHNKSIFNLGQCHNCYKTNVIE